jgi:hypothetical protein
MLRQLDRRQCDGLTVTLESIWKPMRYRFGCEDEHTPAPTTALLLRRAGDARLAFIHPFALGPRQETTVLGPMPQAESDAIPRRRRSLWNRSRSTTERDSVRDADDDTSWPWWIL